MSSQPTTGATEEPPHIITVGGVPVPIQSPDGVTAFGGRTQGVSSSLISMILPGMEGGATAPGTHIANPGTRRGPSESRSITPGTTDDEGGPREESPSIRASERSRARQRGLGESGEPSGITGENPEGENTPKSSVRFDLDEDDDTVKRKHDEHILKEKEDFERRCASLKIDLDQEYKDREERVKEKLKKAQEKTQALYEEKQRLYKEQYEESIQEFNSKLQLSAAEIKENYRKEREEREQREAERRKRAAMPLITQAQQDYEFAKSITNDPERMRAVEEYEEKLKEKNPEELGKEKEKSRESGKEQEKPKESDKEKESPKKEKGKGKEREIPPEPPKPAKPRMSLGLGLSVAPVQTEYSSFRFDPHQKKPPGIILV
ncbi:hypothetical protein RhiJN_23293 [Ceratobasidium sp. AG-Ba]|nr:hypothetical protein RhiJN_23293 [Ceratobasidium sp. AG-Ba]